MGLFDFFSSKKGKKPNAKSKMAAENRKIIAEQDQVLAGLQEFNKMLGADSTLNDVRMRNAEMLIKEGSGR
jgi:hypothetical protein